MKFLATVTIVMAVPTMIASFFGMNVGGIPGLNSPYGFYIVIGLSLIVTVIIALIFRKKDLF